MRILFLHPDLGIGGAERLVVDAAVALTHKGHKTSFITGHHDRKHCFEETKDGTFYVKVVGSWIPRHIFGKGHAFLAYFKMIYMALYLTLRPGATKPDVIFCDQVSACIPVLRLFSSAKVVFFCHFPDKLLTGRETWSKWLYRAPLDWFEETTTGMAHMLLVNSQFTAGVFRTAFPSLKHVETHVVYPSLNTAAFARHSRRLSSVITKPAPGGASRCMFLSINRYERKKNLKLAIEALGVVRDKLPAKELDRISLVLAGGYDERVAENVEHYRELVKLTDAAGLTDKVTFLRSVSNEQKLELLQHCSVVLYTPSKEHFGIVPVEAMYMQRPVIAVNNGGPCETILDEKTGFLCDSDPEAFADAMIKFSKDGELAGKMGTTGKSRVTSHFSFESFADTLHNIMTSVTSSSTSSSTS